MVDALYVSSFDRLDVDSWWMHCTSVGLIDWLSIHGGCIVRHILSE